MRRAAARAAEKGDAIDLDEAGSRERRGEREQRADRRHHDLQPPLRQLRTLQHGLEDQPFRDEAVERRQRRNGDAADQNGEARERHAVNEAAQFFHVPLSGRRQRGAGAKEQQALEE